MSRVARRCAQALVVGLILIAFLASFAAAAPAKQGGKGHRTPAKTAKALVGALQHARTAKAQQRAMLGLMRKLGVAVYTGQGKALVHRAAVARHAFLYDFELAPLAASRARGERVSVADLAARLDKPGCTGRARH
jgi:hypothetical protein